MIEKKLIKIEERYRELEKLISDPAIISDQQKYRDLSREYRQTSPIIAKYAEYWDTAKQLEDNKALAAERGDKELTEMAQAEIPELEA